MPDRRIEILVVRRVTATADVGLADAAGTVDEDFVEAAIVRLIRFFVAEMPLAEDPRRVAGRLEHLHSVVVFSDIRSRSWIVCVTPFLNSCRPLSGADRVGAQVGLT